MIQFRLLILTSFMLSWLSSSAASDEYMEAREPKIDVVNNPDYGIQRDPESTAAPNLDDMPTCLACVCLSGTIFCEEVSPEMLVIPALPKGTGYFYARFNKVTRISNKDFADMETLKKIDLSNNLITHIEDAAFSHLINLEELILAGNRLTRLPPLPVQLILFNANFNRLTTQGVKANAFQKLKKLAYLYLGDNELTAVPRLPESLHAVHLHNNKITNITDETFCKGNTSHYVRPNMEQVRLDGNPIILSNHPYSFICLHSLPTGTYK